MRDRLIHLHAAPGEPCLACGDADTDDTDFLLSAEEWNCEARTCSPSKRFSPGFELTNRADPRTSALKGERFPDPKRIKDQR